MNSPSNTEDKVNDKSRTFWIFSIALAFAMQLALFFHARLYGILRGLPTHDDGYTLARADVQLTTLQAATTPFQFVRKFIGLWIHSPIADLQTMLGLTISDGDPYAPFLLNFWALALVLVVIGRALKKTPWLLAAAVVAVVVQPLTMFSMLYLKADFKAGLFLAAGALVLKLAIDRKDNVLKYTGAGLLSLAAIAKMTAFYVPVLGVGLVVMFELYGAAVRVFDRERTAKLSIAGLADWPALLLSAVIVVVPYLLFFAINAKGYVDYIHSAMSVIWSDGFTVAQRAAYYSPFSRDGAAFWGQLHLLFAACFLAAAGTAIWKRDFAGLALLVMCLFAIAVFYAPLALAPSSNIEFAGSTVGVVLGVSLIALHIFVTQAKGVGAVGGLAVAAVLAGLTPLGLDFNAPTWGGLPPVDNMSTLEVRQLDRALTDIAGTIARDAKVDDPKAVFFFDDLAANEPNLSVKYFQQTGRLLGTMPVRDFLPDEVTQAFTTSDYAVTVLPANGKSMRSINPAWKTGQEILRGDTCVTHQLGVVHLRDFAVPEGVMRLYRLAPRLPARAAPQAC